MTPASAALSAIALLPQAINTLSTSFFLERLYPLPLPVLDALHRARRPLDMLSLAAGVALVARGRATPAVPLALGLKGLSHLVSAQEAHPAYKGELTILDGRALDARLRPDDWVLGLAIGGEARCYPLSLMRVPVVLADTLAGEPVAPTWCPMSHTALCFRDAFEGRRLALQAAGAPENDLTFFSPRLDGLVSQLRAEVMTGPNRGMRLETHPLFRMRWADWKALHPGTTGAWFDPGWKGPYLNWLLDRAEAADAESARPLYAMAAPLDPRLPAKMPVLGVQHRGEAKAYDRRALIAAPVREETIGGEPVIVVYDARHDAARCLVRQEDGGLRPVDLAVDGAYWFAWARCHPETAIAAAGSPVRA